MFFQVQNSAIHARAAFGSNVHLAQDLTDSIDSRIGHQPVIGNHVGHETLGTDRKTFEIPV